MDLCIFCEHISGRLLWYPLRVCEAGVIFLNLRQRSEGALLVAPLRHVELINDVTEAELRDLMFLTHEATRLLSRAFKPDGVHTWCNSGIAAGQSQPHFHFQIVPRYNDRTYTFDSSRALTNTPNAALAETFARFNVNPLADNAPAPAARPSWLDRDRR